MMVADYCPGDIPNILLAFHSHTGCSRKGSDQNTTLKIVTDMASIHLHQVLNT